MAICCTTQLLSPSLGPSLSSQCRVATHSLAHPTASLSPTSSSSTTIRCDHSSTPLPLPPKSKTLSSLSKTLAFSTTFGLLFHFSSSTPHFLSPTGHGPGNSGPVDGGGSSGDWGWSGNGSGDGGSFWSQLFSPSTIAGEEESQSQEWDAHGIPANIVVQLNKLSGLKKYKIYEILFFDRRCSTTVGIKDSFFEMVSLCPGGIYSKAHLQKEVETLATCGMFEKIDLEGKTNPYGKSVNLRIRKKKRGRVGSQEDEDEGAGGVAGKNKKRKWQMGLPEEEEEEEEEEEGERG